MSTSDKSSAPPMPPADYETAPIQGQPPYPPPYSYPGQEPYNNQPYGYPPQQPYPPTNSPSSSQPAYGFTEHAYGQSSPEEENITSAYVANGEDAESGNFANFNAKSIRLGFIKKVFGILAVQMLITGGVMCIFIFSDSVREYSQKHSWLYIASICIYFATVFALVCCENLRRKVPVNLILLFALTLAMSVMLGSLASSFDAEEILMAVGIVFGIVVVCALLGIQQKFDFTYLLGGMVVLTFGLFFFGIFCAIFRNNFANIAYASIGAVLFSLWLVIDIQMIMGGKHKYQCDPEEYIFAALNLYLDIVNILMYVLMLIGASKN